MNLTIKNRIYWSFFLLVSVFIIHGIVTIITLNNISFIHDGVEKDNNLQYSIDVLKRFIFYSAIAVVCIGLVLSFYLTRKIVKPISKIRNIVTDLGKGIIKKTVPGKHHDEIGEMIRSVNLLSERLSAAAAFATKVGRRNFDASFEPLSEKDVLGKAIFSMRDNLKKSEKELYETNYQIQTFFGNIDKVFFSIDTENNKLLQMSPACRRIYGYSEIDFSVNPKLWRQIILEEDKEIIPTNYPDMLAGKSFAMEYRIRKKNGDIRWIETNVTPTLNKKGVLIRIDAVSSDISERKKVEEVLRANNIELMKINAELDKFVYSVSHDLRAPLSSMLGVIEISFEETHEELMIEHLKMLKKSINKLDGFILDILNYSRNARLEISTEEINFNEMIDEITNHLKYMSDSNMKVDVRLDINCPSPFLSDKNRVSVILNNLISNAIRYGNPKADDPFVNIKVDTSDTEANILVKDNGIGISKELHEKIFEMFYRVSENSVGSGLGLYIVKETIDKLHGKIEVESEPGHGTAFRIRIPNH